MWKKGIKGYRNVSVAIMGALLPLPLMAVEFQIRMPYENSSQAIKAPDSLDSYSLAYGEWAQCSTLGSQTRQASCINEDGGQSVDMSFCPTPMTSQACSPPETLNSSTLALIYEPNMTEFMFDSASYPKFRGADVVQFMHENNTLLMVINGVHPQDFFTTLTLEQFGTFNSSGVQAGGFQQNAASQYSEGYTVWIWSYSTPVYLGTAYDTVELNFSISE